MEQDFWPALEDRSSERVRVTKVHGDKRKVSANVVQPPKIAAWPDDGLGLVATRQQSAY